MSDLGDKLLEIKRQKDEYILPENIKKDVTVYGVTGTLEPGSGGGDIKLFDTVEHMQQDATAQDGDLAVVYREEIQPVQEDSEFDNCIFPNTVVLDEAFTDSIYGSFRSTGSGYFDGMVAVSSSSFRFDGYGKKRVRVQYGSQDGITYTRTDSGEELQEFGTTIKYEPMEPWNDIIGKFMKTGGKYFDGMYKYDSSYISTTDFGLLPISGIDVSNSSYTGSPTGHYDLKKLSKILKALKLDLGVTTQMQVAVTTVDDNLAVTFFGDNILENVFSVELCYNELNNYYQISSSWNYTGYVYVYTLDLANETYNLLQKSPQKSGFDWIDVNGELGSLFDIVNMSADGVVNLSSKVQTFIRKNTGSTTSQGTISFPSDGDISKNLFYADPSYIPVKTQLNANINDILTNKVAYSNNGVITGDGSVYDNLDWSTDTILHKIPTDLYLEYNNTIYRNYLYNSSSYTGSDKLSKNLLNCDKPNILFGIADGGNVSGYVFSTISKSFRDRIVTYCKDNIGDNTYTYQNFGILDDKLVAIFKCDNSVTNLIDIYLIYYEVNTDTFSHKLIKNDLPTNITGTFQFIIDEYDKEVCIGSGVNYNNYYAASAVVKVIYKLNSDGTITELFNGNVNSLPTDISNSPSLCGSMGTVIYNNIVYIFVTYNDTKYDRYIRLYKIENGVVTKLYGASGSNTGGTREFSPFDNAWANKSNCLLDENILYFTEYAPNTEKLCKLDLTTGVITQLTDLNYDFKNGREYDNKSMFKYNNNIYMAILYNPERGSSSSQDNYKIYILKYNIDNNSITNLGTADFTHIRGDENGRLMPLIEGSHLYFNSIATCVDIDLTNDNVQFKDIPYHSGMYDFGYIYSYSSGDSITNYLNCGDNILFKFENKQLTQNKLDGTVLISNSKNCTSPLIYKI